MINICFECGLQVLGFAFLILFGSYFFLYLFASIGKKICDFLKKKKNERKVVEMSE